MFLMHLEAGPNSIGYSSLGGFIPVSTGGTIPTHSKTSVLEAVLHLMATQCFVRVLYTVTCYLEKSNRMLNFRRIVWLFVGDIIHTCHFLIDM